MILELLLPCLPKVEPSQCINMIIGKAVSKFEDEQDQKLEIDNMIHIII